MIIRRLAGHALLSVVVLSFVVSIMLSAAIALAYTRRTEVLLYENYVKAYRNIHSAQEYFFALNSQAPVNLSIDLFNSGDDSVQIRSCHWGLWEAAGFKASVVSKRLVEKSMIYGCFPMNEQKSAMWMPMISHGIGLTGSVTIKGDCYVAEGGVRMNVNIGGYTSTVSNHLQGNIYPCKTAFLNTSTQQIQYLSNLLHANWSTVFPGGQQAFTKSFSDTIYRSFSEPTLCIMLDTTTINLASVIIKGNCILYSAKPLAIPATAQLEQIQVIAPTVFVESGFKGSLHIMATDSIWVMDRATLVYPSSLVLFIEKFKINSTNITIANNAIVNGIVYSYQATPDMQRSLIRIAPQALTRGMIYTNGYVELMGKHIGNISAMGFQYKSHDQVLTNILPMGNIDYTALSKHFVIPNLTGTKNVYQTACWIEE